MKVLEIMSNKRLPNKSRLDQYLFEKAYFDSREKAKQEIRAGRIREAKSGEILDKPGMLVKASLEVSLLEKPRFVSRAGEKLEAFLEESEIPVEDRLVLDVGSSTGGFSDCVLQRGAREVICVDVGTHQLHEKLRNHKRVKVFEETDIRDFSFEKLDQKPELVLIDVSFISTLMFLDQLQKKLGEADWIVLFKPQFEAGRRARRKKGVLAEDERVRALDLYLQKLSGLGFAVKWVSDSQIKGAKGNQESFIWMRAKI